MHPAVEAVLFNRALLVKTLTAGPLNEAADLASVAGACRFFQRVVCDGAADAELWQPLWWHECASVRSSADAVALPKGKGFRAAMRQRGLSRMAPEPQFTVSDYTLTVDCMWRGEPLYAARFPLSSFENYLFVDYQVYDRVASQQGSNLEFSSCAEAFAREAFPEGALFDGEQLPDKRCFIELSASVYVERSDGGVACIGHGGKTTGKFMYCALDDDVSSLHLGSIHYDDRFGPFVDFDFTGGRLMTFECDCEDHAAEIATLHARFLLLFVPQVLTAGDVSSSGDDHDDGRLFMPTFTRGELQLVNSYPTYAFDYQNASLAKAMKELPFVLAS